jgi:hypothetical protein
MALSNFDSKRELPFYSFKPFGTHTVSSNEWGIIKKPWSPEANSIKLEPILQDGICSLHE